ncbi:MAG: hypothetical protein WCD83_03045, partial [Pseudolabrys sp.]
LSIQSGPVPQAVLLLQAASLVLSQEGPLISAARLWRRPGSLPATKKSRRGDRGSSSILSVAVFASAASISGSLQKTVGLNQELSYRLASPT